MARKRAQYDVNNSPLSFATLILAAATQPALGAAFNLSVPNEDFFEVGLWYSLALSELYLCTGKTKGQVTFQNVNSPFSTNSAPGTVFPTGSIIGFAVDPRTPWVAPVTAPASIVLTQSITLVNGAGVATWAPPPTHSAVAALCARTAEGASTALGQLKAAVTTDTALTVDITVTSLRSVGPSVTEALDLSVVEVTAVFTP